MVYYPDMDPHLFFLFFYFIMKMQKFLNYVKQNLVVTIQSNYGKNLSQGFKYSNGTLDRCVEKVHSRGFC